MYGADAKTVDSIDPSQYPSNFLERMQKIVNGSFAGEFLTKSKYAIRGSLIGLVTGAVIAMYFKKSVFFYALIGTMGGIVVGHFAGEFIINKGLVSTNTTSNGQKVTKPTV